MGETKLPRKSISSQKPKVAKTWLLRASKLFLSCAFSQKKYLVFIISKITRVISHFSLLIKNYKQKCNFAGIKYHVKREMNESISHFYAFRPFVITIHQNLSLCPMFTKMNKKLGSLGFTADYIYFLSRIATTASG